MYVNVHADDMDVNIDAYEISHKPPLLDIQCNEDTNNVRCSCSELSRLYHLP